MPGDLRVMPNCLELSAFAAVSACPLTNCQALPAMVGAMTRAIFTAIALLLYTAHPARADAGAFRASDVDASGSLDFQEFATLVGHMASSGRRIAIYVQRTGLYGVAFGRVDRNGDGRATPDELLAAQAWIEAYAARHDAANAAAANAGNVRRR